MGYSFEAQSHSEATHKIPSVGFKLFNKNYAAITNSIKKILKQAVMKNPPDTWFNLIILNINFYSGRWNCPAVFSR